VCPDVSLGGTDDAVLVDGDIVDGVTTVTFRRPLVTGDAANDVPVRANDNVHVIASIGTLNDRREPKYHHAHRTATSSEFETRIQAGKQK
jgi:hypothetical protein